MRAALTQLMHGTNTSCAAAHAANSPWNPCSQSYIHWTTWQRNLLWFKGFTLSELMAWNILMFWAFKQMFKFQCCTKTDRLQWDITKAAARKMLWVSRGSQSWKKCVQQHSPAWAQHKLHFYLHYQAGDSFAIWLVKMRGKLLFS